MFLFSCVLTVDAYFVSSAKYLSCILSLQIQKLVSEQGYELQEDTFVVRFMRFWIVKILFLRSLIKQLDRYDCPDCGAQIGQFCVCCYD